MNGPTEPAADLRQAARGLWELYVALTQEGFTEKQALMIIGYGVAGRVSNDD